MTTFTINIAMDVRAYGSVTIEADSVEEATNKLTAEFVADNFSPHGSSEDIDYQHPTSICATEIIDDQGNDLGHYFAEVTNGSWEPADLRNAREFLEQMANVNTPEQDYEDDDLGNKKAYDSVSDMVSDIPGDHLAASYDEFMSFVRQAQEIVNGGSKS